ncbi:hypothetical protein BTJ68_11256, partial [Hortaea werneckii EXF-2000]
MAASPYERAKESVEFLRLKLPEQLASHALPSSAAQASAASRRRSMMVSGRNGITRMCRIFHFLQFPVHEGKLIFSTMGQRQVRVVLLVGRA